MKYLTGEFYVEVKDHRYKIHPIENNILPKRDPPQSLRTQYQVQNNTQIKRNQEVVENNGKLEVKNYPKNKQAISQQRKINSPSCPICRRNNRLEFDKGYYCEIFEYFINKQRHQIDKKVFGQDHCFSIGLPFAKKRLEKCFVL